MNWLNDNITFSENNFVDNNMNYDIWSNISPSLAKHGQQPAWIRRMRNEESVTHTYEQIYRGALHLAASLRKQGVSAGDIVTVIAPNGPHWGVAALAVWRIGAVLAPVHIGYTEAEIQTQLDALNPKCILVNDFKLEGSEREVMEIEINSELSDEELKQPLFEARQQEAVRIYTSGSTGTPKVVRLSHENVSTNFVACSKIVELTSKDRFLSLLPLSHMFEMVGGMLLPLYCGCSIVLPSVLTAAEVLQAMKDEGISVVLAVPRLFRNIKSGMEKRFREGSVFLRLYVNLLGSLPLGLRCKLNAPLRKKVSPNLRYWVSGGSRLDPTIAQFFRRLGISLRQGYGLTETSPVVCIQEAFPHNFDSVGYSIENVEVRIEKPDDQGCGEVLVKGPNVMLGYTNPELTAEVMDGEWFRTGDIGRLDASGNLSLTGRIKRIIITEAGKNVYPEELEVLLERFEGVKEAAIMELKQRPVAVMAMEGENPNIKAKEIVAQFNAKTSSHNHIARVAVVQDLPKTPLGKVAFPKLPDIFKDHEVK